jgi:hypothetical protein
VHLGACTLPNVELIATPLKFSVFVGCGWITVGNAAVVVSGTMLADVLITGAKATDVVGGVFGEQSKAVLVPAKDDDGFHRSTLLI